MVEGGGFEPPKLTRQIYSLIPLATREPLQKERGILLVENLDVNRNIAGFSRLEGIKVKPSEVEAYSPLPVWHK